MAHHDVRSPLAAPVLLKVRRIHPLVCLRIVSVPAQNVVASATDQEVGKQVRQVLLVVLDESEIAPKIGGINGQVRLLVLMEQLDLVIDVPGALVAGCGCQKAASAAKAV